MRKVRLNDGPAAGMQLSISDDLYKRGLIQVPDPMMSDPFHVRTLLYRREVWSDGRGGRFDRWVVVT